MWRGLAITNDNDECYKYDDGQVQDCFIISARAFSVLSGIFGLCVLVNSVFSAILMKSFSRDRLLWTLLILFSAILTLLVLSADIRIDEGTGLSIKQEQIQTLTMCLLNFIQIELHKHS